MMWGKAKENGIWMVGPRSTGLAYKTKIMFGGGDRLIYVAIGRFRFRLMKP